MKPKSIVTALLLAFVLGSVVFLVAKESRRETEIAGTTNQPLIQEKSAVAAETGSGKAAPQVSHKIIAYYFHGVARCPSCLKIEAYTKETIQGDYAQAIKDGRLEWRVINVEEAGNEHFAKDYQLYTKSVVISDVKDGKQVRWKNLEKVWEFLHDKSAFRNYVRGEVNAYLKGI
ncbi:MAG: nitrophenyl compound nitroreductase subunit ArsF family protein [Pseudomonadota bacterium]